MELKGGNERGHACLVPHLSGKASSFWFFTSLPVQET